LQTKSGATVRTALKRIAKLEEQFRTKDGGPQHLWVITRLDRIPALDSDACIEILRKYGHLPRHVCGVVRLENIPAGMGAGETRKFLRDHGADLCGPRRDGTVVDHKEFM
jgi:hypothetical protein